MMRCSSCGVEFVGKYCPQCGREVPSFAYPPPVLCPRCRIAFVGPYCPQCKLAPSAYPFYPSPPPHAAFAFKEVGSVLWFFSILLFFILIIANLAALFYASSLIIPGILTSNQAAYLFVIFPFPIAFAILEGYWFLAWFIFIFSSIVASFAYYAWKDGKQTLRDFSLPLKNHGGRLRSSSSWVMVAQLFLSLLFFEMVYIGLISLFGVNIEVPVDAIAPPNWYILFLLAEASVYEEIVTRTLFIGVFLLAVAVVTGKQTKKIHNYFLGGGFEIDSSAIILIVFSSGMFAAGHVLRADPSSPAWGLWKAPPTFVAGLALGYLFLKKGIGASILFHFSTDYFAALTLMWKDEIIGLTLLSLLALVMVILGAGFFAHYCAELARFTAKKLGYPVREEIAEEKLAPPPPPEYAPYYPLPYQEPYAAQYPPPPYPPAQVRYGVPLFHYRCPRCGWIEARYREGRFQCMRCGYIL